VLVALGGDSGRRVGLTARVDIPPPHGAAGLAAVLADRFAREHPEAAVLAVVSEAPDVDAFADDSDGLGLPDLPHRRLVHELVLALDAHDVPLREALLVRNGRWWSYDCAEPCCAPGAGTPLPAGTSELAAASALSGQVVVADRAELARRIAPVGFLAAAGMARACDDVGAGMAVRSVVDGWDAVVAESCALVEQAVTEVGREGGQRLSDEQVARLAWALRESEVRDRALAYALGHTAPAAEVLWTELTRRAPAPLDAAPATLLAVSAWVRGDGAMANVALDRALTSEPSYTLAGLLRSALDTCMTPAEVRRIVREASRPSGGRVRR
jgi:hypothetical protein